MYNVPCTLLTCLASCHEGDYYNPRFHFCEPEGGVKSEPEGLGSILFGDRIYNSPYNVRPHKIILILLAQPSW